MRDFECHITIEVPKGILYKPEIEVVKIRVEALKWHFSCIHGDPELGDKILCYATEHYNSYEVAYQMTKHVAHVLSSLGLTILRKKVEEVLYDSRKDGDSMIIDADKLEMGITLLQEYLEKGPLTVSFTKKDGSDRVMRCTKNWDLIPLDKHPKPKLPTDIVEERDPQLFVVYDLEKQGWRSFKYTTVKTIRMDGEEA